MDKRHSIESTLLVLGAAGLGVGLMYMLDPQQGRRRREALKSSAEHLLSSTGEALGSTIHGASHTAQSVAHKLGDYAHHLADNLGDAAHHTIEAGQQAGHSHLSDAQRHLEHVKQQLAHRVVSLWSRAKKSTGLVEESHPVTLATEITVAAVSLIGLGAGLMYVLDPSKGRARRAWMRDKAVSISRHTGREARHLGVHLGNRMKGYTARARRSAPWRQDQASMPQSVPM
jgi:hypothetical protein